jgi:hypothetical protein
MFRNINKIDEFANHFNNVSLKYAEKIKGFDPNKIFFGHMLSVGFNKSFIQTVLNEEEEKVNNQNTHVHNTGNLEILLNSNDLYNQKGKSPSERSSQSLVVTPKNTTSKSSAPMIHPIKNTVNNSSSGGGEKNPLTGKIESSHKFPVRNKIKNLVQEEEDNIIENGIQSFSLEDMELEADIEKIFPTIEQHDHMAQQDSLLEVRPLVKKNNSLFKVLFLIKNLKS